MPKTHERGQRRHAGMPFVFFGAHVVPQVADGRRVPVGLNPASRASPKPRSDLSVNADALVVFSDDWIRIRRRSADGARVELAAPRPLMHFRGGPLRRIR